MRTTRSRTLKKNKYFCLRCNDTNWLIECADGCGKIIPRYGKNYQIRKFYKNHKNLGTNHHNFGKLKGENSPAWKGGKWQDSDGYWHIYFPNHPQVDSSGYVLRHRLVYEQYYNCCLLPWIEVHHIIPIKEGGTDDIDNLLPVTKSGHTSIHMKGNSYGLIDMDSRRCSDKECSNPDKIHMRKVKNGKLRPNWLGNKINGWICPTCYKRRKRNSFTDN